MNSIDKISKDSKILIESAKDSINSNLVSLVANKEINLEPAQVEKLLNLINVSLDEGYQKALPYYQNTIKKHL